MRADRETQGVFASILRDEAFHMNYTYVQLRRVSPRRHGARLWLARATRLWRGYLRLSSAIAGVMGTVILTIQYFVLLAPFALLAKRAAKREAKEAQGWALPSGSDRPLTSQY